MQAVEAAQEQALHKHWVAMAVAVTVALTQEPIQQLEPLTQVVVAVVRVETTLTAKQAVRELLSLGIKVKGDR